MGAVTQNLADPSSELRCQSEVRNLSRPPESARRSGAFTFYVLRFTLALALPCAGLAAGSASGQHSLPADAEKISDNVYRIGRVIVDLKERTVTCPAKINMQHGLVEYFAVATRGKLHESVLEVDARPLHIQLGLILLGMEPQGGLRYQGDTQVPKGPPVDVWVTWEKAGQEVKVPAEQMVWDLNKKRPMDPNPWIFSGSMVTIAGFAADS